MVSRERCLQLQSVTAEIAPAASRVPMHQARWKRGT
jgi:hypothetical protein